MEWIKRLAAAIYDKYGQQTNKKDSFLHSAAVRENLKTLYPMQDITKRQREFVIEKLSLGIMILLAGMLLSAVLIVKEEGNAVIRNNQLQRNSNGEGSNRVELVARNGSESAQLFLELEEKSLSAEEVEDYYQDFVSELEKMVLGKNTSFDEVKYDLMLPDSVEGYPFVVEWQTDEEYIDSKGKLLWNELSEAVVSEINAKISYPSHDFKKEERFGCLVQSRASPFSMEELLQKQLLLLEEENRENEFLILPTQYEGKKIVWRQQTERIGFLFLIMTPLLCIVLCFSKDKDLHKRVEEREEQMRMDYPELVSKLALLLGAGMTVQNAWQKMAADYAAKKSAKGIKRYAYEEMLLTANEFRNGIYQSEALEGFGRRCRMPCYNKLATLLTQNLRSGSTNLAELLQEEAGEAFEERKHMARQQGEKAGTKLLFPMMLLLALIMIIIIVPTFLSNRG